MKLFTTVSFLLLILYRCGGVQAQTKSPRKEVEKSMNSFYDFKLKSIDGSEISFSIFKEKKVLIVNTASECGYTPQYADLQAFHEKYGDKVAVLAFPANNFGAQEPGSNAQIAAFCEKNYGITFIVFEKISVKGSDRHPLYQWLAQETGKEPSWNFCKYVIDEAGNTIAFFPSSVNPFDAEILSLIE